ncbi:hypothetical protein D3C87_1726360 [compost metagenome]
MLLDTERIRLCFEQASHRSVSCQQEAGIRLLAQELGHRVEQVIQPLLGNHARDAEDEQVIRRKL